MNSQEMEARILELEKQVGELRDIEAIQRLQKSYGYYIQHWMYEELVDLFADSPDTVLNIAAGIYERKEGVRRYFSSFKTLCENPEFLHQIMQLSGIVDVAPDGKKAQGRWFGFGAVALPVGAGIKPIAVNGIYMAEYIKVDGTWRILKLTWNPLYMVSPFESWVKKERIEAISPSKTRIATNPDKPRDIVTNYPSGYIVPFHFKHPVTGKKSSEAERNAKLKKK